MGKVRLHEIAHARTGDKGDRLNISLIAYDSAHYPVICEQVTEERVVEWFRHRRPTAVRRYALPKLNALNFVLDGVLDGGVNQALNLDAHGKTLSFRLLSMQIEMPEQEHLRDVRQAEKSMI